jgi:N-acetylmuramoyl-L-alanine amidase
VSAVWVKHGRRNRGKKQANFAVLRETRLPAVLVENGFLTNARDAELLKNEAFLRGLINAHVSGIAKAMNLAKKAAPVPLQQLDSALKVLQEFGIIQSPEYWRQNAVKGKTVEGAYAAILIQRVAALLMKGEFNYASVKMEKQGGLVGHGGADTVHFKELWPACTDWAYRGQL